MPSRKEVQRRSVRFGGLIPFTLLSIGSCAYIGEHAFAHSVSPDEESVVSMYEVRHGERAALTIRLLDRRRHVESQIFSDSAAHRLSFAEVAWSGDTVDIFLCDSARRAHEILLSYDVGGKGPLAPVGSRQRIGRHLLLRYQLTPASLARYAGDPLHWACEAADAGSLFEKQVGPDRFLRPLRNFPDPLPATDQEPR